jgi:Uma2 family endonuclease
MGYLAPPEVLALRWTQVMQDPSLRDLPYKIELNARGKIEMSPASNRHALMQAHIAAEFARKLPGGRPLTECSVLTRIGVRVPDVAWASDPFLAQHATSTPFPLAPEICVEIVSPSNSKDEKIAAYLAAGCQEVWVVREDGIISWHRAGGEQSSSALGIAVTPLP